MDKKADLVVELFYFLALAILLILIFYTIISKAQINLPDNDKLFIYHTIVFSDNFSGDFQFNYTSDTLNIQSIDLENLTNNKYKFVMHPITTDANFFTLDLKKISLEFRERAFKNCIIFTKKSNKLYISNCQNAK